MSSLADHLGAPLVAEGVLDQHMVSLPERLLDQLPTAVYVCDRDGAILGWNRRAAELWGRTPKLGDPSERFCGSHLLYRLDAVRCRMRHARWPMPCGRAYPSAIRR